MTSNQCCLVCGDSNASAHYGSVCCNGCKGFFRRIVRNKRQEVCQKNNKCMIDIKCRNNCRACRYAKCLEVNLNPSLVHGDHGLTCWKPEKLKKQRLPFEIHTGDINNPLASRKIVRLATKNDEHSLMNYFILVEKLCDDYFDSKACHMTAPENEYSCSTSIAAKYAYFNPRAISARTPIDWDARYYISSKGIKRSWCRIVTHYLDWASHIPEFANLSHNDQFLLMIDRTAPCIDYFTAYRSLANNVPGLVFSGGTYFPRNEKHHDAVDPEIRPYLKRLTELMYDDFIIPAKNMKITLQEYILTKLIVFLKPVEGMTEEGKQVVRKANNYYQNMLTKLVQQSYPDFDEVMDRLSQIMSFVQLMEVAKSVSNSGFSIMTLFDIANLNGELTYEVHVRQGLV